MIQNIVFDMGNVLMRFEPRHFVSHFTTDPTEQRLLLDNLFASGEWVGMDRGTLSPEQALEGICRRLPESLHTTARLLMKEWHHHMQPIAETALLALTLKESGYRLYLLSNAASSFYDYQDRMPVLRQFDGIFISADWGQLKPCAGIYRSFFARFGLVPSQCCFIDDSPLNIEGALVVGMPGVVFHGDMEQLTRDLAALGVTWADRPSPSPEKKSLTTAGI